MNKKTGIRLGTKERTRKFVYFKLKSVQAIHLLFSF